MQLQATAQVYLNIEVAEDGSLVVTHAFPNDPNPCEVRIYDSEDTPYEGGDCWDFSTSLSLGLAAWNRPRKDSDFREGLRVPTWSRHPEQAAHAFATLGAESLSSRGC
jgi:hypothetical protein